MATGGALVLPGGVIMVGSVAVMLVLPADGSLPLCWITQGLWQSRLGARRRFLSAALAHSRLLGVLVLVVAGQMVVLFGPQGMGLSVKPRDTVLQATRRR